jgi:hypothetical protein
MLAPTNEEWISADHERACSQPGEICKGRIEIAFGARMQNLKPQPAGAGGRLQGSRLRLGIGIGRVD